MKGVLIQSEAEIIAELDREFARLALYGNPDISGPVYYYEGRHIKVAGDPKVFDGISHLVHTGKVK